MNLTERRHNSVHSLIALPVAESFNGKSEARGRVGDWRTDEDNFSPHPSANFFVGCSDYPAGEIERVSSPAIIFHDNIANLAAATDIQLSFGGAIRGGSLPGGLATVRSNRQALKTGLFHLIFNLTTIILGLAFFSLFLRLVIDVSGAAEIKNQIANAHVLFNVFGVLLFVGFVPAFEKLLNKLLPEKVESPA